MVVITWNDSGANIRHEEGSGPTGGTGTRQEESDNGDMLWRLARAAHDYSHLNTTPDNEKKRLIYEAVEFAKKALDKNPSGFAAHKWYAISLSDIGDYEGIQTKIANAFEVQKHFAYVPEYGSLYRESAPTNAGF
ncbi:hypothetical protein NDU88_002198 [Pleurodeles waltl]|uniref:Regulator of microtubule dynamics protein 1 n=1 Tax=Pleurodeles waltl TaxID=8319 RepID=A0AAV7UUW3_PLEWA|nr:hypothetical protein NDU88_002198 [Pleurodeles waltl]